MPAIRPGGVDSGERCRGDLAIMKPEFAPPSLRPRSPGRSTLTPTRGVKLGAECGWLADKTCAVCGRPQWEVAYGIEDGPRAHPVPAAQAGAQHHRPLPGDRWQGLPAEGFRSGRHHRASAVARRGEYIARRERAAPGGPTGEALCAGPLGHAVRAAGDGLRRQGWHDQARDVGGEPAGRAGDQLQGSRDRRNWRTTSSGAPTGRCPRGGTSAFSTAATTRRCS